MSILDSLRKAVPGGDLTKPVMIALGALLASRMFGHKADGGQTAPSAPTPQPMPDAPASQHHEDGGLLGGLGGLFQKMQQGGLGNVVNSWVGHGENHPVAPDQLDKAIGPDILDQLAAKVGLSREELSQQLSKVLPGVVDKMTPNGQLPGGMPR